MSIQSWLNQKEIHGQSCFSIEEIQQNFPDKPRAVLVSELSRLRHMHILANVHNGFYVKLPIQYAASGVVTPYFYIDQLMHFLNKPYYVSLLTAAQLFGAAHQAPQRFCVFTTRPVMNTSEDKNPIIFWSYRPKIPSQLLVQRNSETAMVSFSCPELTAVDLVQYSQYIGGLSRAATILAELLETTNFAKVDKYLYDFSSLSAFQRLGYIAEEILNNSKQGETLYRQLMRHKKKFRWTSLSRQLPTLDSNRRSLRWKIIENTQIEVDDL